MLFALIHELGHLFVGLILGFKPESISMILTGFTIKFKTKCEDYNVKIRNGKIVGNAFFRSQDAGKKFYADIMCIGEIMKLVSNKLGLEVGTLSIFIASLHIYESDFDKIKRICNL